MTTTYTYNKRRLLSNETSGQAGYLYTLGYAYDGNGFLSSLTYPSNEKINYTLDALGRAKEVKANSGQIYASAITYFANGAIKQFTYGNGIVHDVQDAQVPRRAECPKAATMTQNARQLPSRSRDMNGSTIILDDSYAFDANGNVDFIADATPASTSNRSRDLGYDVQDAQVPRRAGCPRAADNLDRLIVADAANQWGQATFTYDSLDNLKHADVGRNDSRNGSGHPSNP